MKTIKITYWTSTIIFSLFFLMNVYMYFTRAPRIVTTIEALGYPVYILDILGTAKILGIIALLIPKFPRLKEWAYAGFAFDLIGAIWSHTANGDIGSIAFIMVFVVLLTISYLSMQKLQSQSVFD